MGTKIILNHDLPVWEHLIQEAEHQCHIQLSEHLRTFLSSLLMRFIHETQFNTESISTTALCVHHIHTSKKQIAQAADCCLFFLGIFPNRIAKYAIDPLHYITTGKLLYQNINHHPMHEQKEIVGPLIAKNYIDIIDILLTVRENIWQHEPISKDYAFQLWQGTGSQYALKHLRQY